MNARIAAAVMAIVATLDGAAVWAQQPPVTLSPAALKEIAKVEAEIDRIEAQALERLTARQRGAASRAAWQSYAL